MKSDRVPLLLVEDSDEDCLVLRALLEETAQAYLTQSPGRKPWPALRFGVQRAQSLQEALAHYSTGEFAVCLLDLHLGNKCGLDLLRATPDRTTPVIVLSDREDLALDLAASQLGACNFLLKSGLSAARLERALRYALNTSEERLRVSEAKLAEAQRVARLGSWEISYGENGELDPATLLWSDELYRIFGLAPRSVPLSIELSYANIHPEDHDRVKQHIAHVKNTGQDVEEDHRVILPDGTERNVQLQAHMVRDSAGKPRKLVGTVQDITARKQVELQLLSLKEDLEGMVRERTEQLSTSNRQLEAENLERRAAVETLRELTVVLDKACAEADRARLTAEKANLAKSEFLSRMSHELRTPLNAILGFGQILELQCEEGSPQLQENIGHILKAGRHLLGLINDVLDIARIETGSLRLSREPVAVLPVVREILHLVTPLTREKDVSLHFEPGELSAACMLADQQRLKQVLLNLVSNAVKFNNQGGSVTLLLERCEGAAFSYQGAGSTSYLRLAVRDTGPGLTAAELDHIFVPFERLRAPQTPLETGGVGLCLTRQLVEAMGGCVGVESQPGQGSTFWVEFPEVLPPCAEGQAAELAEEEGAPQVSPHFTVLYIEDNLSNVDLIENLVARTGPGTRLITAMHGSLGLEMAFQHLPQLIVLDVHLPDMTGDHLLRQIKADPRTRHIEVIILSADAAERQKKLLLSAGASHYLTKPVNVELFLALVRDAMQKK